MVIWIQAESIRRHPDMISHVKERLQNHKSGMVEICICEVEDFRSIEAFEGQLEAARQELWEKEPITCRVFVSPQKINPETAKMRSGARTALILKAEQPWDKDSEIFRKALACLTACGIVPEVYIPILSGGFSEAELARFYREMVDCGIRFMDLEHVSAYSPEAAQRLKPQIDVFSYERLLKTLFQLWCTDRMQGRNIKIRAFENLAGAVCGGELYPCGISGSCGECCWWTEAYGWVMCRRDRLNEISGKCKLCRWVSICHQGCVLEYQKGSGQENCFCDAYRNYYESALPGMLDLLRALRR